MNAEIAGGLCQQENWRRCLGNRKSAGNFMVSLNTDRKENINVGRNGRGGGDLFMD